MPPVFVFSDAATWLSRHCAVAGRPRRRSRDRPLDTEENTRALSGGDRVVANQGDKRVAAARRHQRQGNQSCLRPRDFHLPPRGRTGEASDPPLTSPLFRLEARLARLHRVRFSCFFIFFIFFVVFFGSQIEFLDRCEDVLVEAELLAPLSCGERVPRLLGLWSLFRSRCLGRPSRRVRFFFFFIFFFFFFFFFLLLLKATVVLRVKDPLSISLPHVPPPFCFSCRAGDGSDSAPVINGIKSSNFFTEDGGGGGGSFFLTSVRFLLASERAGCQHGMAVSDHHRPKSMSLPPPPLLPPVCRPFITMVR